jgi:hypothetical protein
MVFSGLDIFVLVSGTFSILATFPLLYLAVRAARDGRSLRRLQLEVAQLMAEVHELQGEMHRDQREAMSNLVDTRRTVETVAELAQKRRLPRVRVHVER